MGDQHFQSLFYRVPSMEVMREVLEYARTLPHTFKVDILDCNKSFSRERVNMSWEDIMEKLESNCHMVIIHRRGYESWKTSSGEGTWCGELGFSTYYSPSYYLFVYISEKDLDKVIKKFGLIML